MKKSTEKTIRLILIIYAILAIGYAAFELLIKLGVLR